MTHPDDVIAGFEERLAETTRTAEQVRTGLAALRATARSADGKVAVTVDSGGNLVDLRLPDPELAALIVNTVRQAQSQLADAARATMPALAGSDIMAELDAQYRAAYPAPPPVQQHLRRSMRLGAQEERQAPKRTRPPRPDDDTEFGDRTLLR
ncbi:YbaB/EbfC family nucleoid-associated protein [Actinophytocola oryzae]|uniref:YbaB/EbfC DNA-binding family protein n=1 Tax=Actinophytocola oryzae TaxID=502181 RepID=A0A4R7VFL6_9PSEU|nr:YbaB/EbfC family nucleoid-associated protein [Actinophytocola oryzae]TDV47839.1 YbaB/EbfC DNA-binding family protein [Actinophytocola oryzae]